MEIEDCCGLWSRAVDGFDYLLWAANRGGDATLELPLEEFFPFLLACLLTLFICFRDCPLVFCEIYYIMLG